VTDQTPRTGQSGPVLIIGYGSTLRGDDGVGPAVAELVEAKRLAGVQVIACHQLTPELADPISQARTVIFVDAAMDLPGEVVQVSKIEPEGQHQVMVHTASPGGLLHLARSVFGQCPEAWLVAIPVAEMGIGEQLSPVAQLGVKCAVTRVVDLIQGDRV